jgi:aspartyl-tRNA(Asn)/glutamyl-tRNA(Gln) amidotransferase subunit A
MARALRNREVAAVELVTRAVRLAQAWQPTINAFSQIWADEALAEARRIDAGSASGGSFAGVPIAVKDLFDVAGHETTACCAAFNGNVAATDAPTIAAIRGGGLVVFGKTNQQELAAGGTNAVSACGPTFNPWAPDRITGGSSGGSGAVVAAGIIPWALGSDTGGSIRIPASMCGTFGLKPTTGKLSTAGMMPLAPSLDTPGPMANTVEDLAELYALMGGEQIDPARLESPARGHRIGLVGGYFARIVHPVILAGVERTATQLEGAGLQVEPIDGEGIDDVRAVWKRITYPEFGAAYPLSPERSELVAPAVRAWMDEGRQYTDEERSEAARRRGEIEAWFRARLDQVDALLVTSTPYWAPRHGQTDVEMGGETANLDQIGPGWHTCAANIAGYPAISLPAWRSPVGAPFGVSLIGRPNSELVLLELAALWSHIVGYSPAVPRLPE